MTQMAAAERAATPDSRQVEAEMDREPARRAPRHEPLDEAVINAQLHEMDEAMIAQERLTNPVRHWSLTELEQGHDL